MENIMMKKLALSVAVAALMGTSGLAVADPTPNTGVTAESQIDLLVVPTTVTCEIGVDNGSAHGDNDGSALVWNVGLTEKGESSPGAGDNQSSITDAQSKLKRLVSIGFKNPSVGDGSTTAADKDCSLAADSMTISMRANALDATAPNAAYPGKVQSSDGQKWFNYGIAVNENAFTNVAETAAGGAGKVEIDFPAGTTALNGGKALTLDGGADSTVTIRKASANTDASFRLGQYPFEVYLQKDYSGVSAPTVHAAGGTTGEDSGLNQYRSHFTVTASYN